MPSFSKVFIIYNPKSTGDSPRASLELKNQLDKLFKDIPIKRLATKYAGHAEEIASHLAKTEKKVLIVSASGDGGYHEVINGVIQAGPKSSAICAVLPSGNANDHSRTMHDKPLWQLIKDGKTSRLDLLKAHIKSPGEPERIRYAHSYIGLGLTPVIAVELNRHTLNSFKELWLVLRTFFRYRPFKIQHGKKIIILDSLIFTNINQMAKVLTLAEKNKPADGRFEVISFPHGRKIRLIQKLLKSATVGLKTTKKESRYEFKTIKKMPMQMDGEVENVKAGSEVLITAAPKALITIV